MAVEDLPPSGAVTTPVVETPAKKGKAGRICCEFCDCELTMDGEVLKRGDVARKYLEQEDVIKDLRAQLAAAKKPEPTPVETSSKRRLWERE